MYQFYIFFARIERNFYEIVHSGLKLQKLKKKLKWDAGGDAVKIQWILNKSNNYNFNYNFNEKYFLCYLAGKIFPNSRSKA